MALRFHNPTLAALAAMAARLGARMEDPPATPPAPGAPAPTPAAPRSPEPGAAEADIARLVRKYGSLENAARRLWRSRFNASERARVAEEENVRLKSNGVLTSADRAELDKFKALGKTPDELTGIVTRYGELETRISTGERETAWRKAARLLRKNEDAAARVGGKEKLDLEFRTETVDGEKVEVPYVKPKEQGGSAVKLSDFIADATKFDPLYLTALNAAATTQDEGGPRGPADSSQHSTLFVDQHTATPAPSPTPRGPADGVPGLREKRVLPSQRRASTT